MTPWTRLVVAALAALIAVGAAPVVAEEGQPPAPAAADAAPAAPPATQEPASAAAAPAGGWIVTGGARGVGRGVAVHGDERKYREDHDTLESGGGADAAVSAYDASGHYVQLEGAFLEQPKATDLDYGELHVRAGRWGHYSVAGDLLRTPAFYDDTYDGILRAFPFSNGLGRDLSAARTTGRLAVELLFGTRGKAGVVFRHDENGGDRSLIKGSVVESLSPFAFRFPSFQSLQVRSDAIDVDTTLPLGPLLLLLNGGYTDEHDRTTTREINWAPTALRDRTAYRDNVHVTLARAGADVVTPPAWPVFGEAGYQFLYAESSADSAQRTGDESVLVRDGDGISVRERSHLAHGGVIVTPARGLVVRMAYTLLDRNRDGNGTELRLLTPAVAATQVVADTSAKDLLRQRPRLDVTYAGLPRTVLHARYAYEHSERDLEARMLGPAVAPVDAVDRQERTNEDQDVHVGAFGARVRAASRLLLGTGYEHRDEHYDQEIAGVTTVGILGDRTRRRDTVYGDARVRAAPSTTLEARGEYQHEHYDRTDVAGDSTATVSAELVTLRAVTIPMPRLMLTGLFSFANRDQNVGTPRHTLGTFRSLEFRGRSATGAVAGVYSIDDRTTAQLQYAIVDAGGSLDNVNHRVLTSVSRRVSDRVRVAIGYAYLAFDQGLFRGDDYAAHVGWTTVSVGF